MVALSFLNMRGRYLRISFDFDFLLKCFSCDFLVFLNDFLWFSFDFLVFLHDFLWLFHRFCPSVKHVRVAHVNFGFFLASTPPCYLSSITQCFDICFNYRKIIFVHITLRWCEEWKNLNNFETTRPQLSVFTWAGSEA